MQEAFLEVTTMHIRKNKAPVRRPALFDD